MSELKLVKPRKGKSPYYRVRGTYLKQYVDRSTGTSERKTAAKALKKWKEEIEQGPFRSSLLMQAIRDEGVPL